MKKASLLALLIVFLGNLSNAQTISVLDSITEFNVPDTVNYNANIGHNVVIQIQGGSPYTGTIFLMTGVDSTAGLISVDTVAQRQVTNKFNDTINFQVNETYNNAEGYRVGGNVVVIWPVAFTLTTVDSFNTNVVVVASVGIDDELESYKAISVYPSPAKNYINMKISSQEFMIKHVRIYSMNSQLLYDQPYHPRIDISSFSSGMYFIKVGLKEEELIYKLIKH
jgi:hypothetical protein